MRIEDRLTVQGRRLRDDVDRTVSSDATEWALETSGERAPARRGRVLLLVAAAVVVLAAAVGAFLSGEDDERLVADQSEATTATTVPEIPAPDIAGEVLGQTPFEPLGSIAYLGVEDAFSDQWIGAGGDEPVPDVDFAEQAVLAFSISAEARCRGPVTGFDLADAVLRPHIADVQDHGCVSSTFPHMFFVAVDRVDLPETFDLVLDSDLLGGRGPYAQTIDTSEAIASFTPAEPEPSGPIGLPPPDGPDLERPEPGREITFDGIGDVRLGQSLGPAEYDAYEGGGGGCGYWGPGEPSHDGDEPLNGLVSIDGDTATISDIRVWENPRYRTASGVGVGTTLESLERVYGDDLAVDRIRTPEPTDGLRARYHDVAAVRNGDRALTFTLFSDVVQSVKLSSADDWGDDEGCA